MSIEQNKAVIAKLYSDSVWIRLAQGDVAPLDELCAPNLIVHDTFNGIVHGLDAFKGLFKFFAGAFPNHTVKVHAIAAEDDVVSVLHTHYGHHTGDFNGMPPSGKPFVVEGIEWYRFQNGKVVEFWRHDDDMGLLRQIGALPMPQAA